jgi:multidrug efflux pump subunit AcrB
MYVSGVMGKFIAVMPVAIIAMLLISLFESSFVLPCHLAHAHARENKEPFRLIEAAKRHREKLSPGLRWTLGVLLLIIAGILTILTDPFRDLYRGSRKLNAGTSKLLDGFVNRVYLPILRWGLQNPVTIVAGAGAIFLLAIGIVRSGRTPFIIFPKLDGNTVQAVVTYPDGTPSRVTEAAAEQLEQAARKVEAEYVAEGGEEIIKLTRWTVGEVQAQTGPMRTNASKGGHLGAVTLELVESADREITSSRIVEKWREAAKDFPGAESLSFGSVNMGPGGTPIEFKLLARTEEVEQLEAAVEKCKAHLAEYPGVFDVTDDSRPGKWEFQIRLKERAKSLGVTLAEVTDTVRASYYGDEVMRLQRGRHEVKLMVRYPKEDRRSLADFDQIRVRTAQGAEVPLTELADVKVERGYSEINRVDQMRSITISGDINESQGNARDVVRDMQAKFLPGLLKDYPAVRVRWEGQQEQTVESVQSLAIGSLVALVAMFVLLTLQFRSYFQPLLIMAVIPFGIVGAVGGHLLMGLPLTMFSFFGIVALTGVVVNDSIVLIDFINHRVREGIPLREALLDAGQRRFRPVMLTSVTTIAGLMPILLESSFQAQLLIPMATSLCFGLMLTTVLVLVLVPTFYLIYYNLTGRAIPQESNEEEDQPQPELVPA